MTQEQLAWAVRTVMIVAAAVVAFLLAQGDITLSPAVKVALGAIAVALAALNPVTIARQASGS
jgi:hypothetical protein